jgi:dCTP deaminase
VSVLSRQEVLARIADRELVISPLIDAENQIGPASVDLRLGTTAALIRGSDLSHVDPKRYVAQDGSPDFALEQGRRRKLELVSVPFGHPLMLHAGNLILVPTLEWVRLPRDLNGIVTARSSWAREGLSIATATFINPCYKGIITLELANLGQIPIVLYPGMRLAQLALHRIDPNTAAECKEMSPSQFEMSYQPGSGDITKADEPFIPRDSSTATSTTLANQ